MTDALGHIPLLIFSQHPLDGESLSLLLSTHLRPVPYQQTPATIGSFPANYYTNVAVLRCVQHTKGNGMLSPMYAQLQLLMEEGFDTKRLHGLSLPMHSFSALDVQTYFPDAKYVFVYNEFEELQEESYELLHEVVLFVQHNGADSFVLNAKFLFSNRLLVLEQLSSFIESVVIERNTIRIENPVPVRQLEVNTLIPASHKDMSSLKELDSIVHHQPFYAGHDIVFVFYSVSIEKRNVLLNRLRDLQCNFLLPVCCILLCHDDETCHHLKVDLEKKYVFSDKLDFRVRTGSMAAQLNELISERREHAIFLDDLNTDFLYAALLDSWQSEGSATLAFSKVSIRQEVTRAHLSDILLKDYPEHTLFFSKEGYRSLQGFDAGIDDRYMLWDYAIRSVSFYKNDAFVIPASMYPGTAEIEEAAFAKEGNAAYKSVLSKHRSILEKCLDEVIRLASSENLSSHKENIVLYQKIASLQLISSHARDELKSLQQLTSQLHQRIDYLENNWYQKLRVKVSRIKKIFFKKKSPGTGSLKRILQFIRFAFSKAGFGIVRKILANVFKRLYLLFEKRPVVIVYKDSSGSRDIFTYDDWIKKKLDKDELTAAFEAEEQTMTYKPKISIIMPVYNAPVRYLKEAIDSVTNQLYPNWELCIADDCSTGSKVQKVLHVYSVKDARIKVHYRTENGHISATSNDALSLTTGEYVLLMDHDDLITKNCLWEIVKALNQRPETDILYSDEDKIDDVRYHQNAHFKPDWAPDHLLSRNYMGHVTVLRKSLLEKIGGFRLGFEGSQDYDLMLRATEQTNKIVHIPKVLYHWRIHQYSAAQGEDVKPYAYVAAKKALDEALVRRGLKGEVKYLSGLRGYRIDYAVIKQDLVTIIIPTKDQTALLKNTIDSILSITAYKQYEIIVLNNNSTSKEFYAWADEYTKKYPDLIQVVEAHFPFNFSRLMNIGAGLAKGAHLLLLNNDVEVIHADWLEIMVSYSQQERIGAVGVKLLYPDDTIQHAGVIIGLGGIAGHSFVGAYKDDAGYFNYIQSVNNYSAVTAACLMCRKEVFDAVGGMDEIFEVEYNDVDLCLKMMEAGYNNVYLPQVELYHYESATRGHPHQSKPSYERHLKEMKLFKDKWQHVIDHDPFYNTNLVLGAHDFSMDYSA